MGTNMRALEKAVVFLETVPELLRPLLQDLNDGLNSASLRQQLVTARRQRHELTLQNQKQQLELSTYRRSAQDFKYIWIEGGRSKVAHMLKRAIHGVGGAQGAIWCNTDVCESDLRMGVSKPLGRTVCRRCSHAYDEHLKKMNQ